MFTLKIPIARNSPKLFFKTKEQLVSAPLPMPNSSNAKLEKRGRTGAEFPPRVGVD